MNVNFTLALASSVPVSALAGLRPAVGAWLRGAATGPADGGEVEVEIDLDCSYSPARPGGWDGPDEPASVTFRALAGGVRLTSAEVEALWPDAEELDARVLREVEEHVAFAEDDVRW